MDAIYVFIIRNDVWIYILCVFGLFWYVNELIQAQGMLRRAVFGLEQERGTQRRNNALIFITVLSSIVGVVYYVNNYVAPTLPATLLRSPTPTPDLFSTPLASPTLLGTSVVDAPQPTPPLAPTVTLPGPGASTGPGALEAATPVPTTETAGVTPTPFIGCNVVLNIDEPGDGAVVTGPITLLGTADTPNFGYYKLEANGPETGGQWADLLGRRIDQPVNEGFLGNVNIGNWEPGPYLVRLVAFDELDVQTGMCVIQVTLDKQ